MDGSGITLKEKMCSTGMRIGLDEMVRLLKCPICNNVLDNPTLASCSHAFCVECIESYSRNQRCTICPVPDCRMPLFLNGGGGKTFKPIPELKQAVDSINEICRGLENSQNNWWTAVPVPEVNDYYDNCDDEDTKKSEEEIDDDEESVDLQKGYVREETSIADDGEGECGSDSE